jgi:hypothetical protein
MKRLALALGLAAALFFAGGCKKQASDNDGIRAGIMQHLAGVGTLNMSSMDMDIRSVSVNGNQAHAEVEFRPKNSGGAPGAGMQVGYNLEKRDGGWVVMKSQPMGGMIQHPDPNRNPHRSQDVHSGIPNFNEILNPSATPAQGALPPGHPPVNSQQTSARAGGQGQSSQQKP